MQITFQTEQGLSLENSFGTIKRQDAVKLEINIGINSDTYGWFELYDLESGGDEWYAEGGLWIDNKTITGYDGVFCLPDSVIAKLKEMGFDTSEVE